MFYPTYTVAIRTLGKAGEAYRTLIQSLEEQEIKPESINVYLAEGYPQPEQVGSEIYYTCPKGLATQRALPFQEIETEYILFLDDDLYLPPDTVKKLFDGVLSKCGDCISPNIYPNHQWDLKHKLVQGLFYSTWPSLSGRYAFRIRCSSYYSYSVIPQMVMRSQSCAGACMLMKTQVYHAMNYKEEIWLDNVAYATGQDQVFAYKLHRYGYKLLIHFDTPIKHLDARSGHLKNQELAETNRRMVRFIIWYRTVFQPDRGLKKVWDIICFVSNWTFNFLLCFIAFLKGKGTSRIRIPIRAIKEGVNLINSKEFLAIPQWKTQDRIYE